MVERKVEMVRLARNEEYYEREAIFGRDVASVFPKQAEASTSSGADGDAFKEALGARKFISETELEAIKSSRGTRADDGSEPPLKPLVEVLREAKEKKEADFAGKWKQMKQGKNRPLDPDELEFFDKLLQEQDDKERERRQQEEAGLDEFRKALQEAKDSDLAAPQPGSAPLSDPQPRPKVEAKPAHKASTKPTVIKAAIKVKPKTAPDAARDSAGPAVKKARVDDGEGEGLAGLLGGYDSDSQ